MRYGAVCEQRRILQLSVPPRHEAPQSAPPLRRWRLGPGGCGVREGCGVMGGYGVMGGCGVWGSRGQAVLGRQHLNQLLGSQNDMATIRLDQDKMDVALQKLAEEEVGGQAVLGRQHLNQLLGSQNDMAKVRL